MNSLKIKKLHKDVKTPLYMSSGAAGFDISAYLKNTNSCEIKIKSGERAIVPTGLAFEIPEGFEAQVRPRSGLAFKHGIGIMNSPGTIDADYRGEVKVCLINLGSETFIVKDGDRIAQVVINEVSRFEIQLVDELTSTDRGSGGFGHTGT